MQSEWDPDRRDERERIAAESIDWTRLGLRPRWVDDDTSTAVAALEACPYTDQGAEEWRRFQSGAHQRGERALYVSTTQPGPKDRPFPVIFGRSRSVDLPYLPPNSFSIHGEPIRLGNPPKLADSLTPTDRDLALRLLNEYTADVEWIAFQPTVRQANQFFGAWTPLLVTPDSKVVAGVWTDDGAWPDGPISHYVLPALPSYRPILQWLAERAVPDLIPTAAARLRKYADAQPSLQTDLERTVTSELTTLTEQYEKTKADLEHQLDEARAAARQVRDPILFGTGTPLEDAVARVLTDAGVQVTRLDDEIGTVSADLLAKYDGRRILIEVKSAGGNANERLADALRKHLRTWPQMNPKAPAHGAALVVNHQHKLPPSDRTRTVYHREEFIDSLEFPVVSTPELFDAWRRADWPTIRDLIGFPPERRPTTIAS